MLQPVSTGSKILADYTHIVGRPLVEEIRELAAPLQGRRVVHVSATAFGGGVAEILYTLVPLMADVGLDVEWQVIYGREEFFNATKLMHNALQGAPDDLTEEQWETWDRYNEMNSRELTDGWDVAIIHDPQPAALYRLVPEKAAQLALALPHRPVDAQPGHDRAAAARTSRRTRSRSSTCDGYVPHGMDGHGQHRAARDRPARAEEHGAVARGRRPTSASSSASTSTGRSMSQVSRFDPWKDPLGVIDAYRIVKEAVPGVQLALVGSMASDDPEGWDYFNATIAHADGDPDIHILNNFNNVGAIEVNAFQSHSDVLVQKSTREGFGLTVSEAIWKGRPFIGGNVGGIPLQVDNGLSGYLVDSVEQCADRTIDILKDPALGKALGRRGKEHVRKHFLTPRYLRDYLRIFHHMLELP